MRTKLLLILSIQMLCCIYAYADTKKDTTNVKPIRHNGISFRYQGGSVLPSNNFVRGENKKGEKINFFQSFAINYTLQTDGSKDWQHIYNFPHYGFGFYTADFFNTEELGYPNAIYGFLGLPLKRWTKGEFGYKLGFGLTYNWKPYDGYDNPFNIAIGSYRTVYIDAGLYYNYHLNKRWDLAGGVGYTHFSNGGTRKPNSGLNLLAPYIELKYNFKDRPRLIKKIVEPYDKHKELSMNISFSARQKSVDKEVEDKRFNEVVYGVVNISAAYLHQVSWRNKFGGGIDWTFDESIDAKLRLNNDEVEIISPAKLGEKMKFGIYGTYEFTIDRLSIVSCLGYTLLRKKYDEMGPDLYQKFGIKYHFKNDLYAGVLVRAHSFSVADFIEWNIGYRIKWK